MTREQQIKKAMAIIRPQLGNRAYPNCTEAEAVSAITGYLDHHDSFARGFKFSHEIGKAKTRQSLRKLINIINALPQQPAFDAAKRRAAQLLDEAVPATRRTATGAERAAVMFAKAVIVTVTNIELTSTRGGAWDKLALVILNDPTKKTLTRHMEIKASMKKPQGRKPKAR